MSKRRRRSKLPEGEFEATVESLSHEGRGITHVDGKTTFLFGALPEEIVKFKYTLKRGKFDEGAVTNVLKPSPQRVAAHCEHFGICGGCSLQHMNHEQQIAHKQASFLELLEYQGDAKPATLLPPLTAKQYGYRRRARLSIKFVEKKDKVIVGFRERGGRLVADITECPVLDPRVGEHLREFADTIYTLEARAHIPQIEITITDDTTAVILRHLTELCSDDLKKLVTICEQLNWQLYLQPKGLNTIHLYHPKTANAQLSYTLSNHQLTLQFDPWQFIQVNSEINTQMIDRALELLDLQADDRVLDLFCGIGNFTLPIAKHCAHVTGIEGAEDAVNQGRKNAELNQLSNAEFYCSDLFNPPFTADWAQKNYNKLLLDPPRAGALDIIENISQWQPERIVYVSCNPATLARDTKRLLELGYQLTTAGIMDMFPHTQHVEAISLFTRQ